MTKTERPRRRTLRRGPVVAAVVVTALAALAIVPDLFRLDYFTPFAQLVALRTPFATAALVVALLLVLIPPVRPVAWPTAVGLAAVAVLALALVLPRVVAADPPAAGGRPLTVLSFNVFEGRTDVHAVADVVRERRPDLISLSEAGQRYISRLAPLVEPLGYRLWATGTSRQPDVDGVAVLVATGVGDVRVAGGDRRFLVVDGGNMGALRFVAFHVQAPIRPGVPEWRDDLAALPRWCAAGTPTIVAGDLNSSLDHSPLRNGMQGCTDAAAERGAGLVGTWPSRLPRWLGLQIDHVLATDGIGVDSLEVLDVPGSDHRAIIARLRLPS